MNKLNLNDFQHIKVISCQTVIEEMRDLLPSSVEIEELDFGLHLKPEKLRETLQQAIDKNSEPESVTILGYGLCSMAVVGLKARQTTLVVPRVDDCIAIFLGSTKAYKKQVAQEPGTYYMTNGWIEVGDSPFEEYQRMVSLYGQERADKVMTMMLTHYKRIAYIDTGGENKEKYTSYSQQIAKKFNLQYQEIPGSSVLVRKMINGPWDDDFVIARPGQTIKFSDFRKTK